MTVFKAFDVSASGLTAQRLRMDVISNNLANVNTTRTEAGTPYRRQNVILETREPQKSFGEIFNKALSKSKVIGNGVRVVKIVEDTKPFQMVYNPDHPEANEEGYVAMPNVNPVLEMVDMISATRAYEANVTALNAAKGMAMKALEIGR